MDSVSRVQILDVSLCISVHLNALEKALNKIGGQTMLFNHGKIMPLREGKTLN